MIPMMTMKMTMMGVMMKMRRWSLSKHLLCILHLHPKFLVWKIISYKNTLSIVLLFIFTQIMWVNWFRTANLIMWGGLCILLSFKVEFLNVFSGCLMLAFPPHPHHSKTSCNNFVLSKICSLRYWMARSFWVIKIIFCDNVSCISV